MKLPDGPKTSPGLQLIQWIANPFGFMDECAQHYGDTFTVRLSGLPPLVFFSNPKAIQKIFTADIHQFDVGRANRLIQPLVGENSLLLLDGTRHASQRRLMMPPFHGERMRTYAQLICEITEQVVNQWKIEQPFIARASMQEITLQVILQVVFGLREGARYQQLKPLLASFLDMTGSPLRSSLLFFKVLQKDWGAWSPWGQMVRCRQSIYELLQAEIAERRQQPNSGTDVLSLLISARDEQGEAMTDIELRDELMTLLVAGHETTATSLAWALYWIHRLPSVHATLLDELEGLGDNPNPMEIAHLPYLNAVCQETLRIHPIVPVTVARIAKFPIQIGDYQFEPETRLTPCIYLTHHREDLYPEPKQFKPERFLKRQYSPYEYLPFGGGNRRCLGLALAQLEMKLVLATILSRCQLALCDRNPVKPARRGVTIAPANGVKMVLKERRQGRESKEAIASSP
ncbi:MAG TPA: cytochrome P450 [Coleofasciculaceae cyanobacterium]